MTARPYHVTWAVPLGDHPRLHSRTSTALGWLFAGRVSVRAAPLGES
jgi:hypothetical protein